MGAGFRQAGDDVVEVAVFQAELLELAAEQFDIGIYHDGGIVPERVGAVTAAACRHPRRRLQLGLSS